MLGSAGTHRRTGNWVAALSEASWGSGVGANAGCEKHPEVEPDLVRITSVESEANSELLMRLFGRKASVTSRLCPEDGPAGRLMAVVNPKAFPMSSYVRAAPTLTVPVLMEGAESPPSPLASEAQEPSPRGSTGSAPGDMEEVDFQSRDGEVVLHDPGSGYVPQWRTCEEQCGALLLEPSGGAPSDAAPAAHDAREDPTCTVDPCSWGSQSLEDILTSQAIPAVPPEQAEPAELNPDDMLRSSLLGLISDPAVQAKIRAMQLFTTLQPPAGSPPPQMDLATGGAEFAAQEECTQAEVEGCGEAEGDGCSSPCSPPPLRRRMAAKRDSVLDDCWLTEEQLRRKQSPLEGSEEWTDVLWDAKRRRC